MAYFSGASIQLLLNDHLFSGFADSADCVVLPEITAVNSVTGADGQMQWHSTGDRGGEFSVMLLATSASNIFMQRQWTLQQQGAIIYWHGLLRERETNIQTQLVNGRLTAGTPGGSVGKGSAKDHTWKWMFERIISNYDAAVFNSGLVPAGAQLPF